MKLADPFRRHGEHIAIELPGALAVFTTRHGGVSTGPYTSLNLGRLTDDDPEAVERNRASLAKELGRTPAHVRQVHGATVRRVRELEADQADPPRADGQATDAPGLAPMVLTADCLPVAIAARGAVAMIHAGWRGLEASILAEGVRAVRELGGEGALVAAIGPGAGACCYEVGEDVHRRFDSYGANVRRGRNLDLKAVARIQLEHASVTVHDVALCSICSPDFFSHRRDHGVTGRQAGVAWLT
jgi:YfiH family protein